MIDTLGELRSEVRKMEAKKKKIKDNFEKCHSSKERRENLNEFEIVVDEIKAFEEKIKKIEREMQFSLFQEVEE